jgi:hypothetical protein
MPIICRRVKAKPKPQHGAGMVALVCVSMLYAFGMSVALGLMISNTNDRVLQLEEESALNYAMAKVATQRLSNLCTHFKVGCTEKYRGR